jgi:hypothetical protein
MNYQDLIAKALNGRSVNSMSKVWGIPQSSLAKYVTGERMPDYDLALRMARDAQVDPADAFEALAEMQRIHKSRNFKLQSGVVQTQLVALLAATAICCSFYIM